MKHYIVTHPCFEASDEVNYKNGVNVQTFMTFSHTIIFSPEKYVIILFCFLEQFLNNTNFFCSKVCYAMNYSRNILSKCIRRIFVFVFKSQNVVLQKLESI